MFGFGISEIITLLIVFIVLINPKDLPLLVRKIGKTYGAVMKQINTVRKSWQNYEEEIRKTADLSMEDPLIFSSEGSENRKKAGRNRFFRQKNQGVKI
ncbi:MAG: hypothetical protein PQJ58_18015 [Spirochaetales bacterium]|nr:hypothetical protein [Spirochaetales bacterium]